LRAAAAPAIPALVSVLTDGELNWRSHDIAADALAAVGPASVDALVLLLDTPHSWTTENVLYALNRIGPPAAAVPAAAAGARGALAHRTSRIRLAATEFLWRSARDATVAPVLEAMLTAPRGYERTTAAKLLFEINRSPVALATIRRELRSPGEEVFTALFALKELGPAAREAIPDVVMLLSSPDEETRGTAARTLASLQCPESCPT
jgi:HEAT repeat protein